MKKYVKKTLNVVTLMMIVQMGFMINVNGQGVQTLDAREYACDGCVMKDKVSESDEIRNTARILTTIFENSMMTPQYTYCENIGDGRGLTFGFIGFTSGTYDGNALLKAYQRLNPSNLLTKYIPLFDKIDASYHDDEGLCALTQVTLDDGRTIEIDNSNGKVATPGYDFASDVVLCGEDPEFIRAQQNLEEAFYWNPSQMIANDIGANLPITKAELYDACINHGEYGAKEIVALATQECNGMTPRTGASEETWLRAFLEARRKVLLADSAWEEAVDRVNVYVKLLDEGNTGLRRPMTVTCYGDVFTLE